MLIPFTDRYWSHVTFKCIKHLQLILIFSYLKNYATIVKETKEKNNDLRKEKKNVITFYSFLGLEQAYVVNIKNQFPMQTKKKKKNL